MTWFIQSGEAEGLPHYFSPKVARATGNSHGWTTVLRDALEFPDETRARIYADKYMPMMQVTIVKKNTGGVSD